MYRGVLLDDERRRAKLKQREDDLRESQRKRQIYERVQTIDRSSASWLLLNIQTRAPNTYYPLQQLLFVFIALIAVGFSWPAHVSRGLRNMNFNHHDWFEAGFTTSIQVGAFCYQLKRIKVSPLNTSTFHFHQSLDALTGPFALIHNA